MECKICSSTKFYIESIDKTKDYDFSEMSLKDIADNPLAPSLTNSGCNDGTDWMTHVDESLELIHFWQIKWKIQIRFTWTWTRPLESVVSCNVAVLATSRCKTSPEVIGGSTGFATTEPVVSSTSKVVRRGVPSNVSWVMSFVEVSAHWGTDPAVLS